MVKRQENALATCLRRARTTSCVARSISQGTASGLFLGRWIDLASHSLRPPTATVAICRLRRPSHRRLSDNGYQIGLRAKACIVNICTVGLLAFALGWGVEVLDRAEETGRDVLVRNAL